MSTLHIHKLHISYGQRRVLNDVSLQALQPGQIVALLGPQCGWENPRCKRQLPGLYPAAGELSLDNGSLRQPVAARASATHRLSAADAAAAQRAAGL